MRTRRVLLVLALFTSLGGAFATGTAIAQDGPDYVGNTPPEGGTEVSGGGGGGGGGSEVGGAGSEFGGSGSDRAEVGGGGGGNGLLPVTGGDIALFLAVAIAAIGLGLVLMRNARTRRSVVVHQ